MNHGKIVDEGESSTIFTKTQNTYTKSLTKFLSKSYLTLRTLSNF